MKIIIPMSGIGKRFADAGYKKVKPLIEVNGKPIIEYVVSLFPDEDDFIFICREDHLKDTEMLEVLKKLKPKSQIVSIPPHKKGPVFALTHAFNFIEDSEPCIVSYCDYYMHWDYLDFKNEMLKNNCDGAIPCYTGFHPHLIPSKNLYANCKVDENFKLLEIREKHSYTNDKYNEFHSPGAYYFKRGESLKNYCNKMLNENLHLNDEFYASLLYQLMLKDHKDIRVYTQIPHFCQWGTPEDLKEFEFWTSRLKGI